MYRKFLKWLVKWVGVVGVKERYGLLVKGLGKVGWLAGRGWKGLGVEGREVFGVRFRSRVGLGAGFDRNGEYLEAMGLMGLGFSELGTVTYREEAGGERTMQMEWEQLGFRYRDEVFWGNEGMEGVMERVRVFRRKGGGGIR